MESDHGTQYESNPSSHHGGMQEDGQTDGLMDRLTIFPDSTSVEWKIIIWPRIQHTHWFWGSHMVTAGNLY